MAGNELDAIGGVAILGRTCRRQADGKLKRSVYEDKLADLHVELVRLQYLINETGRKLVLLFESRDVAPGGTP